ncbi:MAG: hypothetical protein EON60_13660 [Alphaproteobacteria bacterium]|nr:MAG: hypothetical protein EON60_13660 [Alphaproteobacteria bacterium]
MTGYLATLLLSLSLLVICFLAAVYSRYRGLSARERTDRRQWLAASLTACAVGLAFAALKLEGGGILSVPFTGWLTALLLYAALALWVASVVYRLSILRIAES